MYECMLALWHDSTRRVLCVINGQSSVLKCGRCTKNILNIFCHFTFCAFIVYSLES